LEALQGSAKTGNAGIEQRTLATNKQAFDEIEDIFFIAFNHKSGAGDLEQASLGHAFGVPDMPCSTSLVKAT